MIARAAAPGIAVPTSRKMKRKRKRKRKNKHSQPFEVVFYPAANAVAQLKS
jgi:hypothetical protein